MIIFYFTGYYKYLEIAKFIIYSIYKFIIKYIVYYFHLTEWAAKIIDLIHRYKVDL